MRPVTLSILDTIFRRPLRIEPLGLEKIPNGLLAVTEIGERDSRL